VASHSRITLNNSLPSFPLSDAWPVMDSDGESNATNLSLETPGPDPFRHFTSDDFSNLQDYMFEDKLTDSESDEFED
jgi:hypothetical protein